ncbi:PilZ domain-containing protein [Desulfobulbus elongatus]|uniref:PilZ domain-containing protein n=1 Tax=Desulfobulbus elongatus TaxID=53332 RepID=UPI000487BD42|nr:PilZ domain-containing protein [Desulfobulbus elongatus]
MNKGISWDDIPPLEEGVVDWEDKQRSLPENRAFVRLDRGAVSQLVEVREIVVWVATVTDMYGGTLVDISKGGLAAHLPVRLAMDTPVRVGVSLGCERVIVRGLVRHVTGQRDRYVTGIQFVDLAPDAAECIEGLYMAEVFCHAF